MVLKKSNCSLNSGNSLKVRYYDKAFIGTRDHLITKVYINRIIQPADFEEQNANILSISDEYVQDGDLAIQHNFHGPVVFSLNKRKRWLLRETVAKTICYMAEENCEEDFKITLVDNVHLCNGYTYFMNPNIAVCREYWDSHNIQPHVTPRKDASFITDLRKRGKRKEEEGKVTRRRKYHNKHFRAIQRKVKTLPPETELHQQPFIPRNLAEPHGCPEIRYELWSPAEYTSKKMFYRTSPYERIWDKDPTHNMRRNKALKKSKGLRSKRDKQESHFGFSPQGMKEQADEEQEHPGGLGEEWMWELGEVEEVKERERAMEVDLQTLIMKQGSRKKKLRKKGRKADMVDKETYVFVTDDRRKKVKVEVEQINRATSLWTKRYGKGCAIVLENRTKVTDDDFEIVDRNTESENHSDLAGEMLELMKNHLQVFNGNFCVCKIAMEDIVPRKLAELYGHGVEVSLIHPYTFVINLGRSQGHWCMVCQMSPGLGFWPDPESQTSVALRVTLQGRAAEPDICTVNSSLRHAVKQTSRSGHTLTELFALANKVIEETLQQALSTTKSRADLHGNRTIHKQLFSELTVVKTAEEAYLEDKHNKQVLPSVARIDLLTLIDLDFDLIEECSICFASWEGEEWSWISHNVSLLPCRHSFCRQCWQLYLCHNIKEGKTTLYCMEYGCETELDPATVTSLVPPEFLTRWQQQCAESHVTRAGAGTGVRRQGVNISPRWPSHKIKTQRLCRYGVPVQCHCGELWCLLCQKSPHWPALCSHGDIYYKMLLENGNEMGRQLTSTSDMTYFVKLKNCPRCHYPMEKDGGCSHMTCKCSHHFCWVCLGDWDSHVHSGLVCASAAREERTVELDSEAVMTLHASQYNKSVTHRYSWKKITTTFIRSKVTQLVSTQRKKMWRSSPSAMNTAQLDATQAFLTDQLVLVRDLHRLLENCNVLLSNTPRSCQPKNLLTCTSQLAFTTSRLEATLNSSALGAEMLTRLKSLRYLAWSTVDQLVLLAPVVQATVDRHSQGSTRQGSRSQKGNSL